MFQVLEKWKGFAWLLMINLLSFKMSDCFTFPNVVFFFMLCFFFFLILHVNYGVLCVAMADQLLHKSVCRTPSIFLIYLFYFQAVHLISSVINN